MTYNWNELGLRIPDIMLPREGVDYEKWAVIACDQYTSDPSYWQKVEEIVSDYPSTLNLMLPEIFLGSADEEERIGKIHNAMTSYIEDGTLKTIERGCVLVSRTSMGRHRLGLVICVDLEDFDYHAGASSLIRSTERTIVERIPPRMKIRRGAPLELPHILVLIDDPGRTVIEPLASLGGRVVYDTDLMLGGGHVTGTFISEQEMEKARIALSGLMDIAIDKYGKGRAMLMAMGDGNHSLSTAKAYWEEVKKTIPVSQLDNHPARYALCEIENIHDDGIIFEPIHRAIFSDGKALGRDILSELLTVLRKQNAGAYLMDPKEAEGMTQGNVIPGPGKDSDEAPGEHRYIIPAITGGEKLYIIIDQPSSGLEVGTLQNALDVLLASQGYRIDYIHGEEALGQMCLKPDTVGFLLPPMAKGRLFPAVDSDGALPRKTFSMGEASEKRYYIEARSLSL